MSSLAMFGLNTNSAWPTPAPGLGPTPPLNEIQARERLTRVFLGWHVRPGQWQSCNKKKVKIWTASLFQSCRGRSKLCKYVAPQPIGAWQATVQVQELPWKSAKT